MPFDRVESDFLIPNIESNLQMEADIPFLPYSHGSRARPLANSTNGLIS